MRVGIALGSNLGDRACHLHAAIRAIRNFAEEPVLVSRVYETEPIDCPPGSPAFLNAAMEIGWSGGLPELLQKLQAIEREQGRPSVHARNAPRPLDLDILYADELTVCTPELEVPHPRWMRRAFVVLPLADIVPNLRLPNSKMTPSELAQTLDNEGCRLVETTVV